MWTWYLFGMAETARRGEHAAVPAVWGQVKAKNKDGAIHEMLAALDLDNLESDDFVKIGPNQYEVTFTGEGRGRAADKLLFAMRRYRATGENMLTIVKGNHEHNGSPQVYR